MMTTKSIFFLLLFLLVAGSVYGQDSDFGLWYEVNAEKSFSKKFALQGSFNVRTNDNASTVDKSFFEFGATYDPNKYLEFAGSYRIGKFLENDDYYHLAQQIFGDIKGSMPVSDLEFSLRARIQMTERSYVKKESDSKAEYDGRIKLKCKYKIPHFPVDPYVSFEMFTAMFRSSDQFIEKSRSSAGIEYKITKKHAVETEYTYERDNTPHLKIAHLITLGYTYRF